MKKIIATAIMAVHSGQVELTADQAKTRLHALTPVKVKKDTLAGIYAVQSPIQFKAGEEFGFDGEVGKDGRLHDPEAEEIAHLDELDRARAEGLAAGREQVRAEVQDELEKLKTGMQEEIDKAFAAGKEAGLKEIGQPGGGAVNVAPAGPGASTPPDLLTQPK